MIVFKVNTVEDGQQWYFCSIEFWKRSQFRGEFFQFETLGM